jgi:hypothetical protein
MSYKQQKARLQLCIDYKDLAFIEKFGENRGAKNASEAIHELIYDYELMREQIISFKKKLLEATSKQTYEEVRNEQIQKTEIEHETPGITANKDPRKESKWAFLGKIEDPNLKSRVDDERFKPTKKKAKK